MSSMTEPKDKGYRSECIVCGTPLMVDREFCFDHLHLEGEWQFGQDKEQDERAIRNVMPREGLDYWIQRQYEVAITGHGRVIAWEDEHGEVDIYKGKDIEWYDVDERNKQPTGRSRMLTFDNKPFDEVAWRLKQINGWSPRPVGTNVGNLKQIYLTEFRH